jgi:phage tail tape-measure protein
MTKVGMRRTLRQRHVAFLRAKLAAMSRDRVMARFVVTRAPGRAWNRDKATREQAGWQPHAAFMDALADERFVVGGGPAGTQGKVVLISPPATRPRRELALLS